MNTHMTRFRCFQKSLCPLTLDESSHIRVMHQRIRNTSLTPPFKEGVGKWEGEGLVQHFIKLLSGLYIVSYDWKIVRYDYEVY